MQGPPYPTINIPDSVSPAQLEALQKIPVGSSVLVLVRGQVNTTSGLVRYELTLQNMPVLLAPDTSVPAAWAA